MNDFKKSVLGLDRNDSVYIILAIILSIPAFFINLGIHPYLEDESIRALVALEMDMTGNYFFPTLGGVPYFSKPSLYNWILLLFSKMSGGLDEWSTRIPTVLFLYGYALYIYCVHKRAKHSSIAAATFSLLFLTCGRILFWDSFLGLIDIFFSWMMYAMIMEMYFNWKEEAWWKFFLLSYFFLSVGFLLKGFPSILFLGLTFSWLAYLDRSILKNLLRLPNLIGLCIPIILIGGYYFLYNQSGEIENSVNGLLDQATRRTFFKYDFLAVVKHVFTYPFENIYHFLPWSLLVFIFFSKSSYEKVFQDDFMWFCSGAFIINILPYWLSPEVFPRYILMLTPLIFTVFYGLYLSLDHKGAIYKYYQWLFLFLGLGSIVFLLASLMNDKVDLIDNAYIKGGGCLFASLVLIYFMLKGRNKILILVNVLFVLRIAFDLFIMPIRTIEDKGLVAKNDAIELIEKYGDREIRMYKKSIRDYTTIFHIESQTKKIISPALNAEILIYNNHDDLEGAVIPSGYKIVDSIYVRRVDGYMYVLEKKN